MADEQIPEQNSDQTKPDPPLPTHSEDGVDLTLIRWTLSLTPDQRLKVLEDNVKAILSFRHGSTRR